MAMTPEHRLLQRCERFLFAVEALFQTLPARFVTGHLAEKCRALRADIRAVVPEEPYYTPNQ